MKKFEAVGSLVFAVTLLVMSASSSQADDPQRWYTVNGKPATKAEYDAVNLVQEASQLTSENKIDQAAEVLKKALSLAPQLEVARTNYGFVMMRQGKYGEAIEILRSVVNQNPDMEVAWLTLGGCYQSVGRIPEAIDAYKHHLKLVPKSPDAAKYRGLIATLEKEAENTATTIATSPPDADTYLKAGSPLGVKWPDNLIPITVYIPPTSNTQKYKPFFADILKGAFIKWAAASHGKLSFEFVDRPDKAKLICEWSDDPKKVKFQGEGGHAELNYRNQDVYNAKILLLTIDPSSTVPLTPILLAKVALHEVGHALGLIGHSNNRLDIMFFSMDLSNHVGEISERDSKTLRALYANRPEHAVAEEPVTAPQFQSEPQVPQQPEGQVPQDTQEGTAQQFQQPVQQFQQPVQPFQQPIQPFQQRTQQFQQRGQQSQQPPQYVRPPSWQLQQFQQFQQSQKRRQPPQQIQQQGQELVPGSDGSTPVQ